MNLVPGRNRDADIDNRCVDTVQGVGSRQDEPGD